jgi:hypothetical protein
MSYQSYTQISTRIFNLSFIKLIPVYNPHALNLFPAASWTELTHHSKQQSQKVNSGIATPCLSQKMPNSKCQWLTSLSEPQFKSILYSRKHIFHIMNNMDVTQQKTDFQENDHIQTNSQMNKWQTGRINFP